MKIKRLLVALATTATLVCMFFVAAPFFDEKPPDPLAKEHHQLSILNRMARGGDVSQSEFESSGLNNFKPEDVELTLKVYKYNKAEQKQGLKQFLIMQQVPPPNQLPLTEKRKAP